MLPVCTNRIKGSYQLDLRLLCPNLETFIINETYHTMHADRREMPVFVTGDRMSKAIFNHPNRHSARLLESSEDPSGFEKADLYLGGCAKEDVHQLGRILLARSCNLYVGLRCATEEDADAFEADLMAIAVHAGCFQDLLFGERQKAYWSLGSDGRVRSASWVP